MLSKLSHSFPILGQIEIPLHAESDKTHRLLERFTSASVAHLQQLDHLGELRGVLKCGLHSRYEYLILQLYFIHYFKQTAKAFGFSSAVFLPSGQEVSSCEELLKSWAFLEELGHLKGTYEAERFLLGVLTSNATSADFFLSAFKDKRGADFAKQVLVGQDLWSLHRCIAWLLLEHHRDKKLADSKDDIDFLIDMLFALISTQDQSVSLSRARGYFSRIRRLAHIYLDSANLPTHIHFHPTILLQSFAENPISFVGEDDQLSNRLFGSVLDFLHNAVYSSIPANAYKLERYDGLLERFEENIKVRRRSPLASQARLKSWIFAAKGAAFWGHRRPGQTRTHRLRLQFVSDGYFEPDNVHILSEERRFRDSVGTGHWSLFVTSYRGTSGHSCFVDLFETANQDRPKEGKVLTALIEFMKRAYSSFAGVDGMFLWLCDDQIAELVRFVLQRMFQGTYRFRFAKEGKFSDQSSVLLGAKPTRAGWSKNVAWELKKSRLTSERRWEIDCLRRQVREAARGTIICLTTPVFVEDSTNNSAIAEFDGVFIRLHGARVELTLVEAKSARKGAERDARAELSTKLMKLGVPGKRVKRGLASSHKAAFIRLPLI
jgi:hypothetical protein